jgi:hypothetical protein
MRSGVKTATAAPEMSNCLTQEKECFVREGHRTDDGQPGDRSGLRREFKDMMLPVRTTIVSWNPDNDDTPL